MSIRVLIVDDHQILRTGLVDYGDDRRYRSSGKRG